MFHCIAKPFFDFVANTVQPAQGRLAHRNLQHIISKHDGFSTTTRHKNITSLNVTLMMCASNVLCKLPALLNG